ncbi:MAG: hypothetical protein EXQ87_04170 [Alphaproteobacteria bacterium]|nr:hypothetical protein [Alphaproteobacteria bacterium]
MWWTVVLVTVTALGMSAPASSHDLTRLGKVDFKVECNGAAQPEFHRAVALYHSFAWPAATAAFEAIAKADPACGMAHWGRAMVMLDNPFVWPANLPPQKLNDIDTALKAAETAGLKSQREKDYVAAVRVFVADHDKLNHRTHLQSFEDALGKLAAGHPDDKEAAILHALVTSANFNPADKEYSNQLKAARILEPIFKAHPDHPGAAHYIIHSYDYPPIAKHGVAAAKQYAAIAPDAPHAQHMPSHIFTRLGLWEDSIQANRAAAKSAGDAVFDGHHARDYMVYGHLQLARDRAARQSTDDSRAMKAIDHFAASYAYAAMPARLALERDDWKAAAALPLQPAADSYAGEKYPQSEAVNALARGIDAAKSGDAGAAREQVTRLLALRDTAKEAKLSYWADQIEIQAAVVDALALCAEGKSSECGAAFGQTAAREDATEKHVVSPGPILPARELYADMLLEAGKHGEALKEYEAVLAKEPNRYRAIAGAMQAADRAGDQAKARKFAADLVKQASGADSERPSLTQAKQLAAAK